jgi:hypothetical protein
MLCCCGAHVSSFIEYTNDETIVDRNRRAGDLVAWCGRLREHEDRLAVEVALLLDRVADTEECVANAFACRAFRPRTV